MTEYPTAERTATTPLHVSTTPHLAYLLVLLALLAADIATTVWFTRLGLPELNPLLAPIAGSVAAQVAYKAPFALLLIAGTALLAASCDRLQPGAGRYPWLAVAGIYAVPVAWNLVVIAGHTGFHVIPAVVYAPVAVVCAVGVWRAARPRPEALTMPANHPNPRPAGPPPITPPIASPRPGGASMTGNRHRSTPRPSGYSVSLGLIVVLLLTGLVTTVSAEEYSLDISESEYYQSTGTAVGATTGQGPHPYNALVLLDSQNVYGAHLYASMIQAKRDAFKNYASLPQSSHTTVDIGGFATATYGYFKYNVGSTQYLQVYLENVEYYADYPSGYTGKKNIVMTTGDPAFIWPIGRDGNGASNVPKSTPTAFYIGVDEQYGWPAYEGVYYCAYAFDWLNTLNINTGIPDDVITLERNGFYSQLQINTALGDYTNNDDQDYTLKLFAKAQRPYTINITSASNTMYTYTINSNGILLEPGEPGDVTIYVQNSQTGALLTNANLSILAAAGGTETEVINATLPGGTGTFSLEKADYLKYHATATAPGYTLLSPILFGVPEGGTTIVLWMAPDAPPDDPIEEGKSMLYGYIQTQGSQQPISGATITLDGYGSTTTSSTGFYMFNNVTPGTYDVSASDPLHDALSERVTVDAAPTQHNLALKGHFLLTVTIKDGDTLANLQNTTISLSDGQESTQNPATFVVDYGPYTITAAAGGYYPQTQSAYLDKPGTTTATVLLTAKPEPVPPPEMPNYPPHNVRFLCIDEYNRPLQNVTLRAVYQESTNPVDWFTSWLGLSPSVNINSTTLEGTTGLDGSVIFLMVESVQYRMTVTAPAPLNMTKTFDLYPKEDEITIRFVTSARPDLSTMPTYDLTATETDPSTIRLALTYNDTTNATTHLAFQVYDHATGDLIHTQTFDASKFPGTVSPTYDVTNTNGAMYRFGFTAQNSAHGEISQYKGITLKGDNLLVDLGFEDRTLYQWLAVLLLFLFAGAFSGTNVKQGAILVPLFGGGLFWFIGWLPITLGAAISAIGFLGVLVYMRKSEWKVRA